MTVSVDLTDETLARLEAEAARRGVGIDVVIADLAAALPLESKRDGRRLSFIGLGSSTSGRTAREDEAILGEGFGRE